jgi:hypothetical protein
MFLLWIFIKIPLFLLAIGAVIRIVYLLTAFNVVDATCTNSEESELNGMIKYVTTYQFISMQNNVIETIESTMHTAYRVKNGKQIKILSGKFNPRNIRVMDGLYSTILFAILAFALALII